MSVLPWHKCNECTMANGLIKVKVVARMMRKERMAGKHACNNVYVEEDVGGGVEYEMMGVQRSNENDIMYDASRGQI